MIAATVKYDDHSTAWRRIPNSVTESVAYYQKIESDAKAWGKAVATIDAPKNEVFAFLWCLDCHERKVEHVKDEGGDAIRGGEESERGCKKHTRRTPL